MTRACFATGLALLLLAACDKQAPPPQVAAAVPGQPPAKADPSVASATNSVCRMGEFARNRIRAGDDIPLQMYVVNRTTWCFSGFGFNEGGAAAPTVYTQPTHGELRTFLQGNSVVFGYRPKPGYAGEDGFTILMPTGQLGIDSHLKVAVEVKAP